MCVLIKLKAHVESLSISCAKVFKEKFEIRRSQTWKLLFFSDSRGWRKHLIDSHWSSQSQSLSYSARKRMNTGFHLCFCLKPPQSFTCSKVLIIKKWMIFLVTARLSVLGLLREGKVEREMKYKFIVILSYFAKSLHSEPRSSCKVKWKVNFLKMRVWKWDGFGL
jgi:hypothetical protein